MVFVPDLFAVMAVLLYLFAIPVVLLALPAVILGGFVYLLAGPRFRIKMTGWAPGVQTGVRKTLTLAQALRGSCRAE